MSDDVQAAVVRLWRRSRPVVLERIAALEDEMAALRLEVAEMRAERDAR